ncbi:MAG: Xaa-Pro peptidase family protein [Candidatus Methanomethyliaceae archaeon]|nr:Xaa-Pro peptidase family protein [Candidatus Methanomethyliaceae archaeon]
MQYDRRRKALYEFIERNRLNGVLVVNPENIYYLTGSPFVVGGVGKLLYLGKDGSASLIVTDLDYEEASKMAVGIDLVKTDFGERPTERLKKIAGKKLGYEDGFLSVSTYETLKKKYALTPLKGKIEKMRAVKDSDEVARIEKSQMVTERALEDASKSFKEGLSEQEIASEIEYYMRKGGAEAYAFENLVASGPRAVYPHGMPTTRRVGGGEGVVLDLGVKVKGYCSDMTRTVFFGRPKKDMVQMYEAVLESQMAALREAKPGMKGKELDGVARNVLNKAGYGRYFGHGLGHGVGIAVHEEPSVNTRGEEALVAGNVITVEPGVYIPKLGGVRIEDMIVITKGGSRKLTKFRKDMLVF